MSEKRTHEHGGGDTKTHRRIEIASGVHESPAVMTVPLMVLAVGSIALGFFGTPAWPWLHAYLTGHELHFNFAKLLEWNALSLMLLSAVIVAAGIGTGWFLYARKISCDANEQDPLERAQPVLFRALRKRLFVDELYEATVIRLNAFAATLSDWLDRVVWNGFVELVKLLADGFARISRAIDQNVVNGGFDESCGGIRRSSGLFSRFQNGRVQSYLRVIGAVMVILVLLLLWGCRS